MSRPIPDYRVFGPALSDHLVEDQLLATLRKWLHTYLGHVERESGEQIGALARPRSWRRTSGDVSQVPDTQFPRIVVQSAGWANEPSSDGDELHTTLAVTVAALVRGRDADETLKHARMYRAALLPLLEHKATQHPEFPDDDEKSLITEIDVVDAENDIVDETREMTVAGAQLVAVLHVPHVARLYGGPAEPTPPDTPPVDPGDWTEITEVVTTVEPQPLTEPFD